MSAKQGSESRKALRFRFRGADVALDRFSPRATLLDWLREEKGAKGVKEGCGEGDCGACTVVLSRPRPSGSVDYKAVNACVMLLGQVDGAEVITVEDLAEGKDLHPVQQAMVDLHGSQCGFCTPGIVMSLFALYQSHERASRAAICDQLAGNLCRCTGYRPILDAAFATCVAKPEDRFARFAGERRAALEGLADDRDLFVGDEQRFFAAPASEATLAELYGRHKDATLLGGATDVGLWITKALSDLKKIIWLGRVKGFDRIEDSAEALDFYAMAGLDAALEPLAALHPDLREIMRRFGSAQVRAAGTIGGNVANGSPIGDTPPVFIALDATVELRLGAATRTLPIEKFFVAYGRQDRRAGEYLRRVHVPKLKSNQQFRSYKVSKRFDEDISAVMSAFRFTLDGRRIVEARLAYGGMAATPKRASGAEAALHGASLDDRASWKKALDAIASDFTPMTDQRASAAYRSKVAANLLLKALTEVAGGDGLTRIGELRAAE
ncbi:MAG TPA: xanthine dehydrogenase small subunit [Roseiarcus sp.]|nr:xanthine dehydrogenase small subunit [Roseiarcus sp.]